MPQRGRPKLVWLVTVRTNDGSGCHVYGVYQTEPIAKEARRNVEAHLAAMNQWTIEKIKGEHWVGLDPYPLSATPKMAYTVSRRPGSHRAPRVVEVTP